MMAQSTSESKTPELKLFNTLTGRLEPFVPLKKPEDPSGKQVRLYVCGPTVYDDAHLGHARCYITWDVLYRFLQFLGYEVEYVRNVTDVDDKILNRAKERGETPAALAERNYQGFTADMEALNVLKPTQEPWATEYIGEMLQGIQALMDKGAAYRTADGSVYFRVSAKADYGKLKFGTHDPEALKKHLEDLKSGARVDVDEEKESPLDFALWKAVPLSDPDGWESPWPGEGTEKGWGRPGWHMECSAMNHAVFGAQIDIHAGGADLIFPHHENEIAQSEAWTGHQPFAKYWLHNGFVNVSGEKMSKSLGNFSTIKKLLGRYNSNTIRHFLLNQHYSTPVDFNDEALQSSENWVIKAQRSIKNAFSILEAEPLGFDLSPYKLEKDCPEISMPPIVYGYSVNFRNAILRLKENLNTSSAMANLDTLIGCLNIAVSELQGQMNISEEGFPQNAAYEYQKKNLVPLYKYMITLFDLLGFNSDFLFEQPELSVELKCSIQDLIQSRKTAKAEKNWAEADRIRNEILAQGLQILDNKDGTTTVEKDGVEILRV